MLRQLRHRLVAIVPLAPLVVVGAAVLLVVWEVVVLPYALSSLRAGNPAVVTRLTVDPCSVASIVTLAFAFSFLSLALSFAFSVVERIDIPRRWSPFCASRTSCIDMRGQC